jgi:DDE_Tnp_1-associated
MDAIFEGESPRARLTLLLQHFYELRNDREPWCIVYPLKEVLLLVTCPTVAGSDDFDDIVAWGEHHLDFLREVSHHGIPCERWLRSLLDRIDPTLFGHCFTSWVVALWPGRHDFIAIDGKTARRTHDQHKGLKAIHLLYFRF